MCSNRGLSRKDFWTVRGSSRGRGKGASASKAPNLWCARQPRYNSNGSAMETMGIQMLLNECEVIARGDQRIYLAAIDDAHFFRVDNIEKAASQIPKDEFSILLSHTPEIYRQAAHADFNLMLCGHTHGGQLCLPGSIPIKLEAVLPRRMGAGAWRYHNMSGYTSVGAGSSVIPVRLNCTPEITLHCLRRGCRRANMV